MLGVRVLRTFSEWLDSLWLVCLPCVYMKQFSLSLLKFLLVSLAFHRALLAAPANDSFSAPTVVTGLPATATGSNIDATLQVDEPQPTVSGTAPIDYGEASVWFT